MVSPDSPGEEPVSRAQAVPTAVCPVTWYQPEVPSLPPSSHVHTGNVNSGSRAMSTSRTLLLMLSLM